MGRSIRESLLVWFGASIAVHIGLVWAFGENAVETTTTVRSAPERVVVSLLAAPKPMPAIDELPPVESPPPIESPSPVESPPPIAPKPPAPKLPPKPAATPVEAPPPASAPAPLIPEATEMLAAADPSMQDVSESDATSSAIAAEASDPDLPIDPIPDYVAEVRSRIESEKRYPAMARRRSEEGHVVARLSIASDGQLSDLEISGPASLSLRRATREAVEKAAPFPIPPRGPIVIEVPLRWRMRE